MTKRNWFWGLFFIAGAILLLVERMNLIHGINLWSLLLTVLLAASLFQSLLHRSIWGTLFSLAFLAIIYDEQLSITAITPGPILAAAALAGIGISFLYHPKREYDRYRRHSAVDDSFKDVETVEGSELEFTASFSSSIKYVNSDNFTKANVKCTCGGMKLYFDQAIIQNNNAVIRIDASFSGVELYIPKIWTVVNKVDAAFGGVEEKNRNESTGLPVVTLVGNISFSGITILYI